MYIGERNPRLHALLRPEDVDLHFWMNNSNPTLLLSPSLVFKLMFDILGESSVVSTEFLFVFLNSIFLLNSIVV